MELLTVCVVLIIATIAIFLGFALYMATGKIKSLGRAKRNLMEEHSKLSDQLRLKGIAIDRLTREIKRFEREMREEG